MLACKSNCNWLDLKVSTVKNKTKQNLIHLLAINTFLQNPCLCSLIPCKLPYITTCYWPHPSKTFVIPKGFIVKQRFTTMLSHALSIMMIILDFSQKQSHGKTHQYMLIITRVQKGNRKHKQPEHHRNRGAKVATNSNTHFYCPCQLLLLMRRVVNKHLIFTMTLGCFILKPHFTAEGKKKNKQTHVC